MHHWLPLWPHPRAHYVQRVHLVTLLSQVVPLLAWRALVPWTWAIVATAALWLAVASRLGLLVHDRRRSRFVVRAVDEPLFCHWGACFFGAPLLGLMAAAVAIDTWLDGAVTVWSGVAGVLPLIGAVAYAASLPMAAWSLWGIRRRVQVREVEVSLRDLPAELDGYRIVQLSDLHLGSFEPAARGLGWAARANGLAPDLCVITGDLLTSGTGYFDDAAEVVGALRAPDGVIVSLGNHDQADSDELVVRLEARGARVLRNEWLCVERGEGRLVVAGLDDRYTARDDLDLTLAGRPAGVATVLLAHDPAAGDEAARRGVDLILSGHTHGGQLGMPGLADHVNLAWIMGQPRRGLHRQQGAWHFISSGLGNTGPPLRLGVTPEIALLVLRAERCNIQDP